MARDLPWTNAECCFELDQSFEHSDVIFCCLCCSPCLCCFHTSTGNKTRSMWTLWWLELNIDNRMLLLTDACTIHHELKATCLTSRCWITFTDQIKRICHVMGKEKKAWCEQQCCFMRRLVAVAIPDISQTWPEARSIAWTRGSVISRTVGVLKGTEAAWSILSPTDDFTWLWHRLS